MATTEKTCPQCGSQMSAAMVRCRECGTRAEAVTAASSVAQPLRRENRDAATGAGRSTPVSLDDMLAFAEDAGTETPFEVSQTPPPPSRNRPPVPTKAEKRPVASSAAPQKGPQKVPPAKKPAAGLPRSASPRAAGTGSRALPTRPAGTKSGSNLESLSAVRKSRERPSSEVESVLQKAIQKALRQPAPAAETLLANVEPLSAVEQKKQQKLWAKTVKHCRKVLEENYDEQGRAATMALSQAMEELGQVQTAEAVEIIAGYLDDARPSVRETAARTLGETRQITAFEPLVKRLAHESSDLRAAAIQGLGTLHDRRAIRPLVTLAAEDPQFNLRIADALVKLGESAIPQLIEIAEENDPGYMLTAIIALGRLKDLRGLEVLSRQTTHELSTIRSHAIEAIGQMGESKGIRYLVRGLSDPHVGVKIQAALGLKKLGDHRACDALINALNDPDDDVREHVIAALGTCGDKSAAAALIPLLESDNQEICVAAAESLGKLGDEQAVPQLCDLLERCEDSEFRTIRLKILDALRRLKNPLAVPALLKLLTDPAPEIRARAIDAIGQTGEQSTAVDLETILKEDKEESVRVAAAKALGELGDAESVRALEEALSDTVQVRIKAVIALGQIANPAAMLSLTALLRDQLPEVRYHATQALAEIGDQRSIRPIEILAADPDVMVSRGAFKALQKLGDDRPEKQILKAARKRGKKATTIKSTRSSWKDLVNPLVLRDFFWPDETKKRYVVLGTVTGMFLMGAIALGAMFSQSNVLGVDRGYPKSLSFSPDGQQIAVGWSLGMLDLFKVGGKSPVNSVAIDRNSLNAVGYVSDNNLWVGFGNQIVRSDGSKATPLAAQPTNFARIELSRDRKHVAVFDENANVFVYEGATGKAVSSLAFPVKSDIVFSSTGQFFAVSTPKHQLKIFDLNSKEIATLTVEKPLHGFAFSADDQQIAVSHGEAGRLSIIKLADQSMVQELIPAEPTWVGRMKFVNNDQELILYNIQKNRAGGIGRWKIGGSAITFLEKSPKYLPNAISDDGEQIAWVMEGNLKIMFYDLKAKKQTSLYYNSGR